MKIAPSPSDLPTSFPFIMSSVSPSEARAALPVLSLGNVRAALRLSGDNDNENLTDLLYLHHLISRGSLDDVRDFFCGLSDDRVRHLVNATDYHTHFGNSLHTCAYWNTDESALDMFAFLMECGAKPIRNYYQDLPWETMQGILYVHCVPATMESMPRNPDDFTATHETLRSLYEDRVDPAIRIRPRSDGTYDSDDAASG